MPGFKRGDTVVYTGDYKEFPFDNDLIGATAVVQKDSEAANVVILFDNGAKNGKEYGVYPENIAHLCQRQKEIA